MCIPHQKPIIQQPRQIRGQKPKRKHIHVDRETFEHGDKEFVDERKISNKFPQKRQGFFTKLFS
jgi:hypothetical protein